jgi:hypothetical protein
MLTPILPTVVSSWLDVLFWWTILDTHGKLLSVKNPAALQFLTETGALDTYYRSKAFQIFVFAHSPSEWEKHMLPSGAVV